MNLYDNFVSFFWGPVLHNESILREKYSNTPLKIILCVVLLKVVPSCTYNYFLGYITHPKKVV